MNNSTTWLIDSGASRHITGFRSNLSNLIERSTNLEVTIGDDASYPVRGSSIAHLKLESGMSLQLSDVLYVPGIKRNLVSVSALEDKGYEVAFSKGKVLAWPKNSHIKKAWEIGHRYESLYKLSTIITQALMTESPNPNELWHKRLAHLHYKALPYMEKWSKAFLISQ